MPSIAIEMLSSRIVRKKCSGEAFRYHVIKVINLALPLKTILQIVLTFM